MEFLVTKSICFGVLCLGNTEKDTIPYQAELTGALSGIMATHMVENIWTDQEGSVKISLENIKVGVTTTKKTVKMALHDRQANIAREAQWVVRNISITFYFAHVYRHQYYSLHFNELP